MGVNTELAKLAIYRGRTKSAFIPSDATAAMPPSGGGMPPGPPPGDPSMGGGMPPPPPGDPSMGGGLPPMPPGPPIDPSMMGGGGGGGDIRGIIRDELANAGLVPSGKGGIGGKNAPVKADINTIATDVFQLKKMFLHYLRMQGIDLPPDILDGPNRDPATGMPAASPSGGSDVQPGASQQSAIKPIEALQGAFPSPPGGGATKSSSIGQEFTGSPNRQKQLQTKAAFIRKLYNRNKQTEPKINVDPVTSFETKRSSFQKLYMNQG